MPVGRSAPKGRHGFSLVELVVAMSLFGIVGALTVVALVRHRQFAEATAAALDLRARLREAASILSADLRGASPRAGDLLAVGDSAVMMRTTSGVAVVCAVRDDGQTLDLVPDDARRVTRLTSWPEWPSAGQRIAVYDDSLGAWTEHTLTADSRRSGRRCPPPFGTTTDPAAFALRITPPVATRAPGAHVHVLRLALYALYRSADRDWYLGYSSAPGSVRDLPPLQPVSGPYLSYRADGRGGMSVGCQDTTGVTIPREFCAGTRSVGALTILMRARTDPVARAPRDARRSMDDSVRVVVPMPDD